MQSRKLRAVLGGAAAVVAVGALTTQALIGQAGAAGDQSPNADAVGRDQKRPDAATSGLASTPLELAVELAVAEHQETLDQRAAIIRYVGARATAVRTAAYAAVVAQNEAARAATVKAATATRSSSASSTPSTSGNTGSTLACIRAHESDSAGGYSAVNSSSGAGGAYQALPSTWDGYAGYSRAEQAPPAVQDRWAREAIAAAGTRPWAGSGC